MKPEYTKRNKRRVLLEGDWARLWLLLNHKILDEAQVIRAIGIQVEYEKHSVFDVIEEQGWISKKMANIFRQKITEKRIVRDQEFEITQQDKLLAEQLSQSNSIPQEKLHEWLQALDQLHLIGIKCSLTQLLTAREEIPVKKTLQQTDTQYKRKTTRAARKLPTIANELAWNKSDLTADMLLLAIAFNERTLTKKEIAKILFSVHFHNESVVTTLQSKYFLSSQTLQQLKEKSQDAKIYKKKEFIHQADWQLADYITRYKVLPRTEVQSLLRILVELSTINIHYSLDALTADTQLLERQQLHQLIEQCYRISQGKQLPQIEVNNIDAIHGSKTKPKNYAYLLWGLLILIPAIFIVEIWIITAPSRKKVSKSPQKEAPVQHKKVKITEVSETVEKKVAKKVLPVKEVSTIRSEKGFVSWGRFWIAEEQKNALEKVIEVGEKFTSLKLYLDNISVHMQVDKKSLLLKGQMNTTPDFFPSDFPLKFYVVVANSLQTQIYTETSFAATANRQFEVPLQLPYELTPCILSVEIFFKPELQDKFTEYIVNIEKRMNWKYAVFLGTKKQIQKSHDLYKEHFITIVNAVQQQQKMLRSSSLPKEVSSIQDIAQSIKLLPQKSISYSYVTQDLSKLPDAIKKLYNLESNSKDFVEQQIFLELELHKIIKKYEKTATGNSLIEMQNVTAINCEYPNQISPAEWATMDFEKWLLIEVEERKILDASQIQQAKAVKTQHFVETGESIPFSKFIVENHFITAEQLRNLINDFSQKKKSNSLDKTLREKKYLGKIPEKFDHYHVIRKLGEGSFGEVYLAEDKRLKRKVAIKILSKEQKSSLKDFYQEVQTVAKLKHPHIIKVHDVGQVDGHPYFTMDYIDGFSLEALIKQGEHINPVKIARFTIKLAKALFFAHKQGIIHRDIKPANIMIDKNDEPYLMDFGLARALKVENNESGIIGTPHYMSPEQAKGQELTIQSDVYSLGATLYEMLCGHVPFPGKDFVETLRLITEEKPKPPSILYSRVSSELEKICLRALEKDLLLRYRTALAMARDIEEYVRNRTIKKDVQAAVTQQTNSFFWSHTKYLLVIFFLCVFSVVLWWSTWSKYSGENEKLYHDLVSVTENFETLQQEKESLSKKLYMAMQEKEKLAKKASMFDATVQQKLNVLQEEHEYLQRYAKLLRYKTLSKNIQQLWPMAGGNLQRNGFCITSEIDSVSHLLWKFDLKEELYNSPIVGENAVFLSCKEKLYALDKNTGIKRWNANIYPCISPVVTKEFVYVASNTPNGKQNNISMLYALSRETGQIQWSFSLEKLHCPVIEWKNTVYVGGKKLYALNAQEGNLRWKSESVGQINSLVVANNKIAFCDHDKLYTFSYNGKKIAEYSVKTKHSVVAYESNVFLTNNRQIIVYDVDKQQLKKKLPLNSRIFASPTITKRVVYVPTREGISAISIQGKTIWNATIGEVSFSPIVTPLLLYAISNDGYIYIIDAQTGKVCWKYASGSIYAPVVILEEKMYYSAYGTFYCFTNK